MDFLPDQLFDGRSFRLLAVVDLHTRESLAIVPRASFRACRVTDALDRLVRQRARPRVIKVDDGPEIAGRMRDRWAWLNGVELDFSRPGKPTDNAHVEAFDARLRRECLNASWFLSLADARDRIEGWRSAYNEDRPHSALGELDPRGLRKPSSPSPGSCLAAGPNRGAGPTGPGRLVWAGPAAGERPLVKLPALN
jgi:putative transposase